MSLQYTIQGARALLHGQAHAVRVQCGTHEHGRYFTSYLDAVVEPQLTQWEKGKATRDDLVTGLLLSFRMEVQLYRSFARNTHTQTHALASYVKARWIWHVRRVIQETANL